MLMDSSDWKSWVIDQTDASKIEAVELVQELWRGSGQLLRLSLQDGSPSSLILKMVVRPRGELTESTIRRLRSYQIEQQWYKGASRRCRESCRVATAHACLESEQGSLLLLEDLVASGYAPQTQPSPQATRAGLVWLAHFHATFMHQTPDGLWDQGCYWHLDTRLSEWERMPPGQLKDNARGLDRALRAAKYQTLVHGDAKPPNFFWNSNGLAAAVDFQWVGRGCGIRDVALFLDRCLGKEGCSREAQEWLAFYFQVLGQALKQSLSPASIQELKEEWRYLFPVAWADYSRFRSGWFETDQLDAYSASQLELALKRST